MTPIGLSKRSRGCARLLLLALVLAGCNSRLPDSSPTPVELPEECTSFVSEYGRCLGKTSTPEVTTARVEQTRLSLLAEAGHDPSATTQLRAKCISAREHLTATCR